jgi:hypothetical protein
MIRYLDQSVKIAEEVAFIVWSMGKHALNSR